MPLNTANELSNILDLIDQDAAVLAAIANDAADSLENGPSAGIVTTRLGNHVKNVQKVIADMESGVSEGIRPAINLQSVSNTYTIQLTDNGDMITMDRGLANTVTINPVSTTDYPVGFLVEIIQLGLGLTTITASAGVNLNGVSGGSGSISARYGVVKLRHVSDNVWVVNGDIGAIS